MKKISFGNFPLIDMDQSTRHCIDTYSIKSFADLITMNTQMQSSQSDLEQYITPDVILKYFKSNRIEDLPQVDNPNIKDKSKIMKRAFKSLQNFSRTISGNPFYKNKITYPIYIEHQNKNNSHDYDFILLANDLVQQQMLDEIKYDDTLSLTFLFIKDMLYPRVPLPQVGNKDSYTIRSDIAKFIEFSKSNNTDPISAMIKLIKIAGLKKKNGDKNYNGLQSFVTQNKALNQSVSSKFFKLFGGDRKNGEIKDINFLLNEIKHLDIADFFNDQHNTGTHTDFKSRKVGGGNITSHTGYSNYKNADDVSSSVERQYMAQKTQNYNKILSMVDSLINFNNSTDIMKDVDSAISDAVVKLKDKDNQDVDVDVNYDKMVAQLRGDYFEAFIVNLVQKLNNLQSKYETGVMGRTKKKSTDVKSPAESVDFYSLEIASKDMEINKIINNAEGATPEARAEVDRLTADKNTLQNGLNQARQMMMFSDASQHEADRKRIENDKLTSNLDYNIEGIQNELTGVLFDIESSLYDPKKLQNIFDVVGNKKNFSISDLHDLFRNNQMLTIVSDQLVAQIVESMQDTILSKIDVTDQVFGSDAINAYQNKDVEIPKWFKDNSTKIEAEIRLVIDNQLFLLFKRFGRDFGDESLIKAQQYANLRTEKNPVIRKTVTNNNNFKTYVLSEEILINLYEMLNYTDTQKYIAGLIAYPPSKIGNDLNKVKYMIKRLGLEDNPLFIVSNGYVILSQPDFLSLTGTSIFSKIPIPKLREICEIDYGRDLWNNNQMFKKVTSTINKDLDKSYKEDFKAIEKTIKDQNALVKQYESTIKKKGISKEDKALAFDALADSKKVLTQAYKSHAAHIKQYEKERKKNGISNDDEVLTQQPLGTFSYRPQVESKSKSDKKPVYTIQKQKQNNGNRNGNRNKGGGYYQGGGNQSRNQGGGYNQGGNQGRYRGNG